MSMSLVHDRAHLPNNHQAPQIRGMGNDSHALPVMVYVQQLVVLQNKQVVVIQRIVGIRMHPLHCYYHSPPPHPPHVIKQWHAHLELLHMLVHQRGLQYLWDWVIAMILGRVEHHFEHTRSLHPRTMDILVEGDLCIQT